MHVAHHPNLEAQCRITVPHLILRNVKRTWRIPEMVPVPCLNVSRKKKKKKKKKDWPHRKCLLNNYLFIFSSLFYQFYLFISLLHKTNFFLFFFFASNLNDVYFPTITAEFYLNWHIGWYHNKCLHLIRVIVPRKKKTLNNKQLKFKSIFLDILLMCLILTVLLSQDSSTNNLINFDFWFMCNVFVRKNSCGF